MRSPPQPALSNVLVARPGTGPGTVARRDDLIAAAVLAAEDAHDTRNSRPRNVLARVSRRWSRFSDAIWRRRRDEKRSREVVSPQVVVLDRHGRVALNGVPPPEEKRQTIQPAPSHVFLHRERELRLEREEEMEIEDEMGVCSMRETSMRRVRQVGAREDDDTLLMLPRVASISFSAPDSKEHNPDGEGKRVQLPRVSALMPMRSSPRPSALSHASPVSSAENRSSLGSYRSREHDHDKRSYKSRERDDDERSYASQEQEDDDKNHGSREGDNDESSYGSREEEGDESSSSSSDTDQFEGERGETWDVADVYMRQRMFCRLPTGLKAKDIESAIDEAVVEIASDEDTDDDQGNLTPTAESVEVTKSRALSDVHHQLRPGKAEPFSRRASSSMQSGRRMTEEEWEARPQMTAEKSRYHASQDFALFEDDYLSFQGFQGYQYDGRSHQSMAALLRSKRISSVTDSHSEDSEEAANVRSTQSVDSRRSRQRNGLLSPRLRLRRHSAMAETSE